MILGRHCSRRWCTFSNIIFPRRSFSFFVIWAFPLFLSRAHFWSFFVWNSNSLLLYSKRIHHLGTALQAKEKYVFERLQLGQEAALGASDISGTWLGFCKVPVLGSPPARTLLALCDNPLDCTQGPQGLQHEVAVSLLLGYRNCCFLIWKLAWIISRRFLMIFGRHCSQRWCTFFFQHVFNTFSRSKINGTTQSFLKKVLHIYHHISSLVMGLKYVFERFNGLSWVPNMYSKGSTACHGTHKAQRLVMGPKCVFERLNGLSWIPNMFSKGSTDCHGSQLCLRKVQRIVIGFDFRKKCI